MRHKKSGKKLGRNPAHRKAMLRNLARSLLTHERIRTTESRAKALRSVVDKLVTLALKNDVHSRRLAYRVLENHGLVKRLFDEIGPRFPAGGGGGYTRVVKLALPRAGDASPMAMIELAYPGEAEKEDKAPVKAQAAAPVEAKAEPAALAEPEAPAEEAPAEAAEEAPEEPVAEAAEAAEAEEAAEEAPAEESPETPAEEPADAPAEEPEKKD